MIKVDGDTGEINCPIWGTDFKYSEDLSVSYSYVDLKRKSFISTAKNRTKRLLVDIIYTFFIKIIIITILLMLTLHDTIFFNAIWLQDSK